MQKYNNKIREYFTEFLNDNYNDFNKLLIGDELERGNFLLNTFKGIKDKFSVRQQIKKDIFEILEYILEDEELENLTINICSRGLLNYDHFYMYVKPNNWKYAYESEIVEFITPSNDLF